MRFKITPLNIASAILIVGFVYLFFFDGGRTTRGPSAVMAFLMISLWTFMSVADVVFRRTVKTTGRLWLIELAFIAFVAVLIVLISGVIAGK